MTNISAMQNALWHAAIDGRDTVVAAGQTRRGETTISRHTLVSDADAATFVETVGKRANAWRPVPIGETLEKDEIYSHNEELVIVKRRTMHDGGSLSRDDFVGRTATVESKKR